MKSDTDVADILANIRDNLRIRFNPRLHKDIVYLRDSRKPQSPPADARNDRRAADEGVRQRLQEQADEMAVQGGAELK